MDPVSNYFWHRADRTVQSVWEIWGAAVLVNMHHIWMKNQMIICWNWINVQKQFARLFLRISYEKSLPQYVRSTHTWCLESFDGMFPKYTPKRNAFEYDYFIARTCLAAVNHNYHLLRPYAFTKDGRMVHHQKFSKPTGMYSVCRLKVQRAYSHVEKLLKAILLCRSNST